MYRSTVWTTLVLFVLATFLPACSEVQPTQESSSQVEETTEDFAQFEEEAQRYELWIERMDPFVTESEEGAYVFDEAGFLNGLSEAQPQLVRQLALSDQSNEDVKVIAELKASLAYGNETMSERASAAVGCWNYWWGRRCCFNGWDAEYMISLMYMGALISTFYWVAGAVIGAYAWWADRLNDRCGGFCLNVSWVGGVWVTCP